MFQPEDLTFFSTEKIYLHCPSCGKLLHRRSMNSFTKEGDIFHVLRCHQCGSADANAKKAIKTNGALIDECPEIRKWWDYEQNYPFRPEQFTHGAQFIVKLRCPDCGLELCSGIHSLLHTTEDGRIVISHKGRCRKFRARESKQNLVLKHPRIKDWWDYNKNGNDKPEDFTVYSAYKAHFVCPTCGAVSFRRISDAFEDVGGVPRLFLCPCCAGKKLNPGVNTLDAVKPELAKEWSENNARKANEVLPTQHMDALWNCPRCGGEYHAPVNVREAGDDACPYCAGKKALPGYNTLDAVKPELAKEWSEKNVWKAAAPVNVREAGDDACPYCAGKKVLPGVNSFAATHSELVKKEWASAENILMGIDPDQILDNYDNQVWWICGICGNKYLMSVKKRLLKERRSHNPCIQCNGRRWKRVFTA